MVAVVLILLSKEDVKKTIELAAIQSGTVITDADIKEYDGEQIKWRIRAEKAHEKEKLLTLKQPKIDLYTKEQALVPITANNGNYDKTKQIIFLEGSVKVKYEEWNLDSDALEFHQGKDQIHATKPFVLYQEGVRITGSKMSIFKATEKVTVHDVVMKMEEK